MTAKKQASTQLAPDKAPLTESQATMLSALTGIDASKFKGLSVVEIASEFRWQIDPNFFLFVRVCGQVVKYNPATGTQDPVPFATVYAEETTCSLLGRFPIGSPWGWFFPFHCETEVVAQTTTDGCGNFCVWIPRFEIEWILRFRLERICYLELFTKPTVGSILNYLQGTAVRSGTASNPSSAALKPGTALYTKAEQLLGTQVVHQLAARGANTTFGSANTGQEDLLARPAFPSPLPPPLPKELRKSSNLNAEKHRSAVKSTLANKLGIDVNQFDGLDLNHYCGPFLRCFDILIPEWVPIFEVPDVSFRVTQDVNGTGTQEVIYSGGLFDIPWNLGGVSNVTLLASPIAISITNCNNPDVPCGNVPSIELVGLMPVVNPPLPAAPYIDANGYATRPNPPHPDGTIAGAPLPPATAPYTGSLQLYGCTQVDNAAYYRLRYTYTAPGSSTASALNPFVGLSWPLYREVGGVLEEQWPVADSSGWYPVIPTSDNWLPNSVVLEWDTVNSAYNANGLYTIQLEVADSSKTLLATSAPVGFVIDNSAPSFTYDAVWSYNSDLSGSQPLPTDDCPVIDRTENQDVYIQINYSVSANHLKYVEVNSGGCGGGATLYPIPTTPAQVTAQLATVQHWYEDAGDNTVSNVVTYKIPSWPAQGVYSFDFFAASRAFNPAGSDGGPVADWNYNPTYVWTNPSFAIAIVNI